MKESKETTKPGKVCPLFAMTAGLEKSIQYCCILDECAWWVERKITTTFKGEKAESVLFEGCAVVEIAENIGR